LDTGSSNLWIVDTSCANGASCPDYCRDMGTYCTSFCDASCCRSSTSHAKPNEDGPCDGKNKFDSSKSTSYKSNGEEWDIQYGIGSASGFLGQDTVSLGPKGGAQLVIPKTTFGQATDLSSDETGDPSDGILGLAFQSIAVDDVEPPFQRAYKLGLLDKNLFTVYLKADGTGASGQAGGQITYGGYDSDNCDSTITYFPLSSESWWEFNLDATYANSKKRSGKWTAISDTGTSLVYAPSNVAKDLFKEIGATYDASEGLYKVDCGKKFTWSVSLKGDKHTTDQDSVLIKFNGICYVGVVGDDEGEPEFILGDVFIRENCQVYDFGGKQVGFAKTK